MAINPKQYIDKLLLGLQTHGKYYNMSTKQFYSTKTKRYCTKYILEDKDDKSTRMEVYNKLEILKFLVREWCKVTGEPVPESCLAPLEEGTPTKNEKGVPVFKNYQRNRRKKIR